MIFVAAGEADKAYFKELNRACYREVVERQFGEPWDDEYQSRNFDNKWQAQKFQKILVKDDVIGGYWVDRHVDHDQLRELQIHPVFQGRGWGTIVLQHVMSESDKHRRDLMLRVLYENRALLLYKRNGFEVVDDNGTQFVMLRKHG